MNKFIAPKSLGWSETKTDPNLHFYQKQSPRVSRYDVKDVATKEDLTRRVECGCLIHGRPNAGRPKKKLTLVKNTNS